MRLYVGMDINGKIVSWPSADEERAQKILARVVPKDCVEGSVYKLVEFISIEDHNEILKATLRGVTAASKRSPRKRGTK